MVARSCAFPAASWIVWWNRLLARSHSLSLDQVASTLVSQVNNLQSSGSGLDGLSGRNFFDPSGVRNEVFTGGYYADPEMRPITWTVDQLWTGIFYWDRVEKGAFVANYT